MAEPHNDLLAKLRQYTEESGGSGLLNFSHRRTIENLRVLTSVTANALDAHMRSCDDRYIELAKEQERRHHENTVRMDRQDSTLSKIMWTLFSVALGMIGVLLDLILRGFDIHLGK